MERIAGVVLNRIADVVEWTVRRVFRIKEYRR